jgi:dual oxidase
MVRDRNNLLWFSDLLNKVSRTQEQDNSHLDIRVQTYVTQKRKNISQHVFRWLLEKHRTDDHPYSPMTGLVNPTHFGRPDIKALMEQHYVDMCKVLAGRTPMNEKPGDRRSSRVRRNSAVDDEIRVGVFFCGPPVIGQQLADQCSQMTAKARNEGRKVEYRFMIEVFG